MEKIKLVIKSILESEKGRDIAIVLIVIMVGIVSFELGRLSKDNQNLGVKIKYSDKLGGSLEKEFINYKVQDDLNSLDDSINKNFFASNRGTKYYSINCSAGKKIKLENRIYFTTREDAEKAGYEFSSSC